MSVILASAGYDHTIRFWDALTGVCSRTIQHTDSQVNRLEITSDKRFLAAAGNLYVRLYDIKQAGSAGGNSSAAPGASGAGGTGNASSSSSNPVMTFEGHNGNVTLIAFQIENKWMVLSSEDGTVKVWDVRSPSVQRNYKHYCPVNEVVIHPNQGELISCDHDGNIRIWDLGENQCTHPVSYTHLTLPTIYSV